MKRRWNPQMGRRSSRAATEPVEAGDSMGSEEKCPEDVVNRFKVGHLRRNDSEHEVTKFIEEMNPANYTQLR